jgi:hypothetical protein
MNFKILMTNIIRTTIETPNAYENIDMSDKGYSCEWLIVQRHGNFITISDAVDSNGVKLNCSSLDNPDIPPDPRPDLIQTGLLLHEEIEGDKNVATFLMVRNIPSNWPKELSSSPNHLPVDGFARIITGNDDAIYLLASGRHCFLGKGDDGNMIDDCDCSSGKGFAWSFNAKQRVDLSKSK